MPNPVPRNSRKSGRRRGKKGEWSIKAVAVALAIVIAILGWAFAAANYAHAAEGWRRGDSETAPPVGTYRLKARARTLFIVVMVQSLGDFVSNAFLQIPKAPAVVMHLLRNAKWLIVVFVLLESLVALYYWYARKLQLEWARAAKRGVMSD